MLYHWLLDSKATFFKTLAGISERCGRRGILGSYGGH